MMIHTQLGRKAKAYIDINIDGTCQNRKKKCENKSSEVGDERCSLTQSNTNKTISKSDTPNNLNKSPLLFWVRLPLH